MICFLLGYLGFMIQIWQVNWGFFNWFFQFHSSTIGWLRINLEYFFDLLSIIFFAGLMTWVDILHVNLGWPGSIQYLIISLSLSLSLSIYIYIYIYIYMYIVLRFCSQTMFFYLIVYTVFWLVKLIESRVNSYTI